MIEQALYGMLQMMLVKWCFNDLPHAAGLFSGPGPHHHWEFYKTTPRGSAIGISRDSGICYVGVACPEDMTDLSNLLNASGIQWDMYIGTSRTGHPWPRYKAWVVQFNYSDLEQVVGIAKGLGAPMLSVGSMQGVMTRLCISSTEQARNVAGAIDRWYRTMQYCHTVEDLERLAGGVGTIKLYHGAPSEFARLLVEKGPNVPYRVEDVARKLAKMYGLAWVEIAPYVHRKDETVRRLSTATAPVAYRWATSFPRGEILSDVNSHLRMCVAGKKIAKETGVSLEDAIEQLHDTAIHLAPSTGIRYNIESAADILKLPDTLDGPSWTGSLVELEVDIRAIRKSISRHVAEDTLESIRNREETVEEALHHWNNTYKDFRIPPSSARKRKLVIEGYKYQEIDLVEEWHTTMSWDDAKLILRSA